VPTLSYGQQGCNLGSWEQECSQKKRHRISIRRRWCESCQRAMTCLRASSERWLGRHGRRTPGARLRSGDGRFGKRAFRTRPGEDLLGAARKVDFDRETRWKPSRTCCLSGLTATNSGAYSSSHHGPIVSEATSYTLTSWVWRQCFCCAKVHAGHAHDGEKFRKVVAIHDKSKLVTPLHAGFTRHVHVAC
jgi:hypothetical protein